MEKLIELLNEYAPDYCKNYPDDIIMDEIVISKRFGFIKWLVDNDKIDQTNKFFVSVNVEGKGMGYTKAFEGYESLLMLLAIQDEPIEFLISILK